MEILKITKHDLEHIRKFSENNKIKFPYPIYLEYGENESILVIIKFGKIIHFFSHADIIIPENIDIQNLKIILNFKDTDLKSDVIKNARQLSANLDELLKKLV